jgi:hypothetical protein
MSAISVEKAIDDLTKDKELSGGSVDTINSKGDNRIWR